MYLGDVFLTIPIRIARPVGDTRRLFIWLLLLPLLQHLLVELLAATLCAQMQEKK